MVRKNTECNSEHIIQTEVIGPSQLFVSHCEATKASSPPGIHAEAELPIINRAAEDKAGAIIEPVGTGGRSTLSTRSPNFQHKSRRRPFFAGSTSSRGWIFPLGVRDFHLKPWTLNVNCGRCRAFTTSDPVIAQLNGSIILGAV